MAPCVHPVAISPSLFAGLPLMQLCISSGCFKAPLVYQVHFPGLSCQLYLPGSKYQGFKRHLFIHSFHVAGEVEELSLDDIDSSEEYVIALETLSK